MAIQYLDSKRIRGNYVASSTIDNGITDLDAGNADSAHDLSGFIVQSGSSLIGMTLDTFRVNLCKKSTGTHPAVYLVMDLCSHTGGSPSGGTYTTKARYTSTTLASDLAEENGGRTTGIPVTFNLTSVTSSQVIAAGDRICIRSQSGYPSSANRLFLDVTDLSGATDITKGFTIDAAELAYTFCADFTQSTVDDKATLGAKADLAKTFDFTSATGWVTYDHEDIGTGGVTIDSSTDNRIEGASAPMEHHDRVVYDLGQAVSDTEWTLDFDFNYSAIATHRAWIPCSLSSVPMVNSANNITTPLYDNSMGIQINDNGGTTYFQSKVLKTGATLDETGTQTLSTNTTYYARVQRTSATEMKIQLFANASHRTAGTPTSHSTTITQSDHAGVIDLRYIVVGVAGLGNNPETTSFWVDNIKLVATAKNDSFDLPENTLFEETDTYKTYWLQDAIWKVKDWLDSSAQWDGGRGVFAGGNTYSNQMTYVTIASGSNGTDFGNLTVGRGEAGACSNGSRICWGGGQT